MTTIIRRIVAGLSIVTMLGALNVAIAQKPKKAAPVTYAAAGKIISARCSGCHSGPKPAEGISLNSYEDVMKAKLKGAALVVASKPAKSVLLDAIKGLHGVDRMPPGAPLSAADTKTIETWIAAGAKK